MEPVKFSCRSKEFACLSNLYEADFTIDGIEYRHVEGYLRSTMFRYHNEKAATHLRLIQSPYACKLAARHYELNPRMAELWKSKQELEHMKIAAIVKFIGNSNLRRELMKTGNRPLVCCDTEDEVSGSTKRLAEVLTGIRSIAQGIQALETHDETSIEADTGITRLSTVDSPSELHEQPRNNEDVSNDILPDQKEESSNSSEDDQTTETQNTNESESSESDMEENDDKDDDKEESEEESEDDHAEDDEDDEEQN